MFTDVLCGVLIPFAGTSIGAACALFMKGVLRDTLRRFLSGFAAGVMAAASVWSLLLPALEQIASPLRQRFIPPVLGFWLGVLSLALLDRLVRRLYRDGSSADREDRSFRGRIMLVLAVTLHNIPEGMAVGAVFAGLLRAAPGISAAAALVLSLGISVQNIPEGAVVSMPLREAGMSKARAVVCGVLSGAVEPLAALLMLCTSSFFVPIMPYLLSFAAGAMFYVVVEELIPDTVSNDQAAGGAIFFSLGFTLMMALDVALG